MKKMLFNFVHSHSSKAAHFALTLFATIWSLTDFLLKLLFSLSTIFKKGIPTATDWQRNQGHLPTTIFTTLKPNSPHLPNKALIHAQDQFTQKPYATDTEVLHC